MITCPECKTEYEKEAKYCFKCRIAFTDDLPENISKYLRRTPSTSNITSTPISKSDKPPLSRNPSVTGTTITQQHHLNNNKPPLTGSLGSNTGINNNINSNNIGNGLIPSSNVTSFSIAGSNSLSSGSLNSSNNSNSSINSVGSNSSVGNNNNVINNNIINSGGGTRPRLQSSPVHPTNPLPPLPNNSTRMSVPVSTSPTIRTPPPPPTANVSTTNTTSSTGNSSPTNFNTQNNNNNNININNNINKPPTPPINNNTNNLINRNNNNTSPINTPPINNHVNNINNQHQYADATTGISSPQTSNEVQYSASKRPLSRRIPPPPPTKKTGVAKWDCIPEQPGDLAFSAGDIITIISKDDDGSGWWLGSVNNVSGIFPASYLSEIN